MSKSILQINGLNKSYSGIKILNDIKFDLKEGEVHALVGENGAGKTTLIKIISGVEKPDIDSEIIFDGKSVNNLTPIKSIEMGISVIYQDISLFPNLSIAENICIGMFKHIIIDWKKIYNSAKNALDKIGCADIDPNVKLGELSVGKQQIVALARAITLKSKVIIMDEPTASLSKSEVNMLYKTIEMLKKDKVSVIYISHKLDEVFTVADRITVLRDGDIIATKNTYELDNDMLISLMVGRELIFSSMQNKENIGRKIFEVKELTKEPLFREISFCLYKNEILGITGLVGAKRSEMAQAIFGLLKLDKGSIILNGEEIVIKSVSSAIDRGICYLPEDRRGQGVFINQNMMRNITITNLNKVLNKIKFLNRKKEISLTEKYIESLNIRPKTPYIKVENMSGGNQQKVLFSRWLNSNPELLIVDEPTSGIDIGAKIEIHRLLRELAKSGVGVILISSDMTEVLSISDRILIMSNGKIVDEVASNDATQEGILKKGLIE